MLKWRIGDVTITKVVELEIAGGNQFGLPQATPDAIEPIAWLQPHFADENGRLHVSIHTFPVETPEWSATADSDPDQGIRTPLDMFEKLADTPTLVIGTHFAGTTAGRIVRDGDAYRLDV